MSNIKIFHEQELREHIHLDSQAISCIESAFSILSDGKVVMPPILSLAIKEYNGEVDVKTAYLPGIDSFAIKISPGFFDNPKLGLPSTSGLMTLFDSKTGVLKALLLDNGYLTDVRTAAAGGVSIKYLSNEKADTLTIIGTGLQSKMQFKACCLVRNIKKATIVGRDLQKAQSLAKELSQEYKDITIEASDNFEQGVKSSQIVITTTPAHTPIIQAKWLQKGQHITAMGSDQDHKNELAPQCLVEADHYIPDRQSQTAILGELHHAIKANLIKPHQTFTELGDVVSGKKRIRQNQADITICDLTGTGVQDTAIANYSLNKISK